VGETCNWVRPLQFLHDRIMIEKPEAILNLDDDQLFTDDGIAEIKGHLEFFCEDRYEYQTLFAWDSPDKYNAAVPDHWSSNLFRAYPNDRWATHFVQHAPEAVARSERFGRLKCPVMNYGYMDADVRADYWSRYKLAGKIDAHTMSFIRPPSLRDMPGCPRELCKGTV